MPSTRKDLIFARRRREEAEGERRMIGSGLRLGFEDVGALGFARRVGGGCCAVFEAVVVLGPVVLPLRKTAVYLRT